MIEIFLLILSWFITRPSDLKLSWELICFGTNEQRKFVSNLFLRYLLGKVLLDLGIAQ